MLPKPAFVAATILLSGTLGAAQAQTASPTPAAPAPDQSAPATPPVAGNSPAAGKRVACREDARAKKLRGMDLADSMQLCMAEARVACVKEAIEKKMPVPDRKAFFKTCMAE